MLSPDCYPAFVSPLTDQQHAQIGRIAVLWGHIDFILDEILLKALKLTKAQRTMFIGEKPIGPKLDLLKPAIAKIKDEAIRGHVQKFYTSLNDTKTQRNHIFHGCWGWRADNRTETISAAARHPKSPTNPVKAAKLAELERALCRASRHGADAFALYRGEAPPVGPGRFIHGQGKPRKWLEQWKLQRPLDDANWDHSYKEGELPRLVDPMG